MRAPAETRPAPRRRAAFPRARLYRPVQGGPWWVYYRMSPVDRPTSTFPVSLLGVEITSHAQAFWLVSQTVGQMRRLGGTVAGPTDLVVAS